MGERKTHGGRVRGPGRAGLAAASVLLVFLSSHAVRGLVTPISTVWGLTGEADLVVLARVVTVLPRPTTDLGAQGLAVLSVQEAWKGSSAPVIFVPFERLICPNGPVYLPGETVVAFLERTLWLLPTYRTLGFLYGTRYPSPGEVGDYRALVRRAASLDETQRLSEAARRAWHVEAASRPGTRWDGLYGLMAEWMPLLHWTSTDVPDDPADLAGLSEADVARIAEGFVRSPPVDRSLPMALFVLAGRPDARVDEAAVAVVEGVLARKWDPRFSAPGWLVDAVALVLRRLGDPDPVARLEPVASEIKRINSEDLRTVWARAREDLRPRRTAPSRSLPE